VSRTNARKNDCFQVTRQEPCGTIPGMDFQSLATLYRTKTDEVLLQLAAQRITLKPRCFHGSRVRHPNVGRLDSGKLGDITFSDATIWAQARDAQYRNASKFAGIRK